MNASVRRGLVPFFYAILVGFIVLAALLYAFGPRYNQATPTLSAHLKSNIVASAPLGQSLKFNLPETFYTKKLILLGEIHGYAAAAQVDCDLVFHLNQRTGLKDYLAELSPVEAAYFNAYLLNGDEGKLKPVFDGWLSTSRWSNNDFKQKLAKIKAFDDTRPPNARISFTGIDQVHNFKIVHDWLGLPQPYLKGDDTQALASAYLPYVASADPAKLLGGQKTKDETLQALRLASQGLEREAIIFGNYQWQVKAGYLKDRPAYGLWGLAHVLKTPINKGFKPFALRVANSDLPAAGAMSTIAVWSDKGAVMVPNSEFKGLFSSKTHSGSATRLMENDGPLYYLDGLNDLRAGFRASGLNDSGVVMFSVSGPHSPFANATEFGQLHAIYQFPITYDAPQKPVSEVFDYAILIRGSDAVKPAPL